MSVTLLRDLSWSSATAGFVAVLVGFTSSVAIVFQAAQAFGATPEQITSWMWALGLGMGLCSAIPSLKEGLVAQQVPEDVADQIVTAAGDGFTEGTRFSAWAAGVFLALGFLSTFGLGSRRRKE